MPGNPGKKRVMVAILGYSREQIFAAVKDMYTAVAEMPTSHFHFPVGESISRLLGYAPERIARVPEAARESFAGVGCPFTAGFVQAGDRVLDIGAGSGHDSLIAADVTGPEGHVIALDLTPAMTGKLQRTAARAGVTNLDVIQGSAESLPLADQCVDVITSNGALNLVPGKRRAVAEMFRVLRPGGRLQIADVVIDRPVTVDCHDDPRLWVECVVGATVDEDFVHLFRDAGFEEIEILRTHDYFSHSPSAQTREVAASFGARSIEVSMRRGQRRPTRWRQWMRRIDPRRVVASMWRRGLVGTAGLVLALLSCYGTLAAVSLLALLGTGRMLDDTLWAGAIALFTLLTAAAVIAGIRYHRGAGPAALAIAGAAVIHYALFVDYHMLVELAGFVLLIASVWRDIRLRRREESRALGLDRAARA